MSVLNRATDKVTEMEAISGMVMCEDCLSFGGSTRVGQKEYVYKIMMRKAENRTRLAEFVEYEYSKTPAGILELSREQMQCLESD